MYVADISLLSHLLEDGLQTGLWTGLAWDLLQGLAVTEGIDVDEFAEGEGVLRGEVIVQDLLYHLPVTRLQGRVPQVRDHWQLSKGHNLVNNGVKCESVINVDKGRIFLRNPQMLLHNVL